MSNTVLFPNGLRYGFTLRGNAGHPEKDLFYSTPHLLFCPTCTNRRDCLNWTTATAQDVPLLWTTSAFAVNSDQNTCCHSVGGASASNSLVSGNRAADAAAYKEETQPKTTGVLS